MKWWGNSKYFYEFKDCSFWKNLLFENLFNLLLILPQVTHFPTASTYFKQGVAWRDFIMGLDIFTIRDKKTDRCILFVLNEKKWKDTFYHFQGISFFKFQVAFIKEVHSLCMLAIIHCFPKKALWTFMSKPSVVKPWFSVK